MCGRTSSARPPQVWVRQTGARRFIVRRQSAAPQSNQHSGNQSNNQRQSNNGRQAASTGKSSKSAAADSPNKADQSVSHETYQPSYNVGPHFYLPVLRYLNMKQHQTSKKRIIEQSQHSDKAPTKHSEYSASTLEPPTKKSRNNSIDHLKGKQSAIAEIESFIAENVDEFETSDIDAKFSPRKAEPVSPLPLSAPASPQPSDSASCSPELVVDTMRWGLIPSWTKANNVKEADSAQPYNLINARAESLPDTKTYRHLLANNRCVVLVDLYYEWAQSDKKGKQPYVFQSTKMPEPVTVFDKDEKPSVSPSFKPDIYSVNDQDDSLVKPEIKSETKLESKLEPETKSEAAASASTDEKVDESLMQKPYLLLAGLFDKWHDPSTGQDVYTITILTQSASQRLAWAHERQPVMLSAQNAHRWLRCDLFSYDECRPFTLKPSAEGIEYYACPTIVGNVRNQTPECVMRLEDYEKSKKSKGIARFFQPTKVEVE